MDKIEELKQKIAAIEKGEGEGDLEALKKELADLEAKAKEGGEAPPTTPSGTPPAPETPPPAPPASSEAPTPPSETTPPAAPNPPPVVVTPPMSDPDKEQYKALALELLQLQLNDLPEAARTMIAEKSGGDPIKMRDLVVLARSMGTSGSIVQPPAVNTAQAGGTTQTGALTLDDIRSKAANGAYA